MGIKGFVLDNIFGVSETRNYENEIKGFLNMTSIARRSFGKNKLPKDWEYSGVDEFILKHGKFMEFSKFPRKYKKHKGKMKECYMNAYRLAAYNPDMIYYEGVAHKSFIPLYHAWCVDRTTGKVADPTWDSCDGFFGVGFNTEYIKHRAWLTQIYGVFWAGQINVELMTDEDTERALCLL